MIEGGGPPDPNPPPDDSLAGTSGTNRMEILEIEPVADSALENPDDYIISDDETLRPDDDLPFPPEPLPAPPEPSPAPPEPLPAPPAIITPRLKVYPENTSRAGPWVVFFRPKPNGKPLNGIRILKDLGRWTSVAEVTKVRPNKMRVVVTNLQHANQIVASEFFTREYRVYIPSRDVEIEGVVTDESLTAEDIKRGGVGRFKSPATPDVKILDCCQLSSASIVNGQKKYTLTGSFRVTFEGTALPHYVVIDGLLRLPVRLFVPRPMNCQNCKSMGHTASHCCNKTRCSNCGEKHADGDCTSPEAKCVYCKGTPHDLSTCEAFKSCWDKQKRSLKERSKRSYADIVKRASPPVPDIIITNNVFNTLPDDEGAADTVEEGASFVLVGNSKKRKAATSPQLPRKNPAMTPSPSLPMKPAATDKKNPVPPGFRGSKSDKNPPAVPGTSKTPDVPIVQSATTPQSGLFKLSDIVDNLFTFFNVPESIRSLVTALLPVVKTYLQQLVQQWPLLAMFISIDV